MSDTIVQFDPEDARMRFAIDEAQTTLRSFFDAYVNPKPNQTAFLLKGVRPRFHGHLREGR